jgi:hypothetical protein
MTKRGKGRKEDRNRRNIAEINKEGKKKESILGPVLLLCSIPSTNHYCLILHLINDTFSTTLFT